MTEPRDISRDLITTKVMRRFAEKVNKTDGCWEWQGTKKHKYGIVVINQKIYKAHRIAWIIAYGEIPDHLCVCHKCDNPCCVRPTHLWLGTQLQNQEDKVCKGRQARKSRNQHTK